MHPARRNGRKTFGNACDPPPASVPTGCVVRFRLQSGWPIDRYSWLIIFAEERDPSGKFGLAPLFHAPNRPPESKTKGGVPEIIYTGGVAGGVPGGVKPDKQSENSAGCSGQII
jgi:hypothetical protein